MFVREGVTLSGETVSQAPAWFTELFAHRRWIRRSGPFPHVYVRDVFVEDFYKRLADEYQRVLDARSSAFSRVADNYSASGIPLAELRDGPLALFTSREWHDLIASVAGVEVTGDVEGSIHHHSPDSPAGWPHNDLNPAWFAGPAPGPDEVRLPDPSVNTKTGAKSDGVTARETVRAVALLFYLGNPGWQPGDGGETGLYANIADPAPTLAVPPLDNSMVIFECTPRSWHTYLGYNRASRSSIVMWLHRPKDDAIQRWGGDRIVQW